MHTYRKKHDNAQVQYQPVSGICWSLRKCPQGQGALLHSYPQGLHWAQVPLSSPSPQPAPGSSLQTRCSPRGLLHSPRPSRGVLRRSVSPHSPQTPPRSSCLPPAGGPTGSRAAVLRRTSLEGKAGKWHLNRAADARLGAEASGRHPGRPPHTGPSATWSLRRGPRVGLSGPWVQFPQTLPFQ